MARIQTEDLRLNIIINGDDGRKNILQLEHSAQNLKIELDSAKKSLEELAKSGKQDTEEFLTASNKVDELTKSLQDATDNLDKMKRQISLESMTLGELQAHIKETRSLLKDAVPDTANWQNLNNELQRSLTRQRELQIQSKATHYTLCEIMSKARDYGLVIKGAVQSLIGLYNKLEAPRDAFLAYDEAMVDAMKTTGLAREEMESLSNSLKKIDTKTAQNELLSLVRAGGKLGITRTGPSRLRKGGCTKNYSCKSPRMF